MANAASVTRKIKSLMREYDVDATVRTSFCGHRDETDRRAGWSTFIFLDTEKGQQTERLATKGALLVSDIPEIHVSDSSPYFLSVWQPV